MYYGERFRGQVFCVEFAGNDGKAPCLLQIHCEAGQ